MSSPSLQSRVALVTGGSRGIGAAIAQTLARAGAHVIVNYVCRAVEAQSIVEAIVASGGRAIAVQADVSKPEAVSALLRRSEDAFGPVGILVNNAGIALPREIDELTEIDFDKTIAVNLKSAFLCIRACVPAMKRQRWGRIINISSGAARGAGVIGPHYNASKAGMEGLTRGYAARLVKDGITVNAVAPSMIETEMVSFRADRVASIPIGRMGYPEEVARAVLMAIEIDYMTGQTIVLNGGLAFH
ncbi:MAG: 3-oxoacyl-ACP reductase FabG [Bradyrhizobiaceae bacterium]|nr:3-oxoacyl-ACP reductase FabG [Bradyrhizobiaceae bacterium]